MDARLEIISDSVREINRNLMLLKAESDLQNEALEDALEAINQFEAGEMHALRVALENI